jgi:hypothetical protein
MIAWEGFADKKFDLPLVYYTDSACYVANPTEKFMAALKPPLVFQNKKLKIYKTLLLDSIPFHMETYILYGESSSSYYYRSPFMKCSSFEITQKTVPDVNYTEQWATMVIHEYFHGFQFMHPAHLTHFETNITVSSDTLQKLYKSHQWFKESVDKENDLLLAALGSQKDKPVKPLIDSFFLLREERRKQTKTQLNVDIAPIEQIYELMEGTARYAEYSLYDYFARKKPDDRLAKSDTSYHSYQYFHNYNIEKDPWLYLSANTNYYYATGFNMLRLFDKSGIHYKKRLLNEGGLSLEQVLKQSGIK